MSVTISFSKLFTYATADPSERVSIENLVESANHVHGLLQLKIGERTLPYMGFFGPDDVCFNAWVQELSLVLQELGANSTATYTFDEGEQGQPAFRFRRTGDHLFVSIVESQLSGTSGDPSFQDVGCIWADFCAAVSGFLGDFRSELQRRCPDAAHTWWRENARESV